jgi:hypothetical protein
MTDAVINRQRTPFYCFLGDEETTNQSYLKEKPVKKPAFYQQLIQERDFTVIE